MFASPAQAADGAGVLLTMLSDADAVIDAVEAALPSVREGKRETVQSIFDAIAQKTMWVGEAGAERNFEPSFRLTLAAEDARLIEESAQRRGIDVPLFSTIRRRLAQGAKDHGDEDMSATYWTSASRPDLTAGS